MACCKVNAADVTEPVMLNPLVVRFLVINDVYQLDNLPNFAEAKKFESKGADIVIGTLAGDFLQPSLLSTIDKGVGMVDCLGAAGIDYVCFGNHESMKMSDLIKRFKESKFKWLNSNITNMPVGEDIVLPEYEVVEVKNSNQSRKIAIGGLCTEDPAAYHSGKKFGGSNIEPVNDTAVKLYTKLMESVNPDSVVVLTHQDIALDRELASRKTGISLILGGHDHDPFNEVIENCQILKVGIDAETFGIVDLIWDSPKSSVPVVRVTLQPASFYSKDANVEALVKKHYYAIDQMKQSILFSLPDGHTFSSKKVDLEPASLPTFLLTTARHIYECDCVVLAGGCFHGDADYGAKQDFSYADLTAEIPFDLNVIVLPLPGSVLVETIQYMRASALKYPIEPSNKFAQTDDSIQWYPAGNIVTAIGGQAVDPNKIYNTLVSYLQAFSGLDNIEPLLKYVDEQKKLLNPAFNKAIDSTQEFKHAIIDHYSKVILYNLIAPIMAESLSGKQSDTVTKEEFKQIAKGSHGEDLGDLLVNNLFNLIDEDGNGVLDRSEIRKLYKKSASLHVAPSHVDHVINHVTGFFTSLSSPINLESLTRSFSFSLGASETQPATTATE